MKYFLHAVIFVYYLTFLDTLSSDLSHDLFSNIISNPMNYWGAILYHIWFLSLWIVFAKVIGTDKWLRRALVFYWIPAIVFFFVVVNL